VTDKYNDGYTHEALHTVYIIGDMWERHVVDTQCVEEYPDIKDAVERANQAIQSVYQLIGQKLHSDEG